MVASAAVTLVLCGTTASAVDPVTPGPAITVNPSTGVVDGQQVQVAGTGLSPQEEGAILECNDDADQPTIPYQGFAVPVGCSSIFGSGPFVFVSPTVFTSTTGTFSTPFVIHTGVLGPPTSGTDSAGHDASADASAYPCPPTPAQQAAGDTCNLTFGDLGGDVARFNISFGPPLSRPPTASVVPGSPPRIPLLEEAGVSVEVTASGLAPDSPALVAECNLTPGEPPSVYPGLPIGCTQPAFTPDQPFFPTTDATGSLSVSVTLVEGNVGATAPSAAYPCPPSAGNLAAGGSCAVVVVDAGQDTASAPLWLVGPLPVPTVAVSPDSGLLNGQEVQVTGSGFSVDNVGNVLECDVAPGEPTVPFGGVAIPVGCSSPFTYEGWAVDPGFGFTDQNGDLQGSITVRTGVLGPPVPITDSTGGDAVADAARYPCPPTPAEQAMGARCVLLFADNSGEVATAPITFSPPRSFSPQIAVLAKLGTIDLAAIPDGTSVVVTGSGFTPGAQYVVLECPFVPGAPVDPTSGLPLACQEIDQIGGAMTDEAGGITSVVVVTSLIDYDAPPPGTSPCTAGATGLAGSCEIVVRDGAGDLAEVPIGIVPGPGGSPPPPVYAGKATVTLTTVP